jgi:FkbM family methyltransferase
MPATADDVAACYRLILGREPDPEGLRVHINAGLSIEAVVRSLLDSAEYRTRAESLQTVMLFGREFVVRASQTMYGEDYEPYLFHHLMKFMAPGKRFLDVGANIGMFAIHAAFRGAEVIAVEARPSNNSLILENARHSGVSIELHPLAVSDSRGYAVLDVAADNENAAIRRTEAGSIGDYVVALALIDELIGDRRIDVMKIDIEGHEYRAMLGARKMLERCRPVIVTEYHPDFQQTGSGVPGSVYLEYLQQFGYGISIILRSGELKPSTGITEIDELCRQLGYHVDLLLKC